MLRKIKNIQFLFQSGLVSYWNLVIMVCCFIHIEAYSDILTTDNNELADQIHKIGIGAFLASFSLMKYIR